MRSKAPPPLDAQVRERTARLLGHSTPRVASCYLGPSNAVRGDAPPAGAETDGFSPYPSRHCCRPGLSLAECPKGPRVGGVVGRPVGRQARNDAAS
jgi:hypothetical protein